MITQRPRSPKRGQAGSFIVGRAGFREKEFVRCNNGSPAIAQASRGQSTGTRLSPVQMPTALSACWHSGQLVLFTSPPEQPCNAWL